MKQGKSVKFILAAIMVCMTMTSFAQCVMCTKTAANLDDESAKGLNDGIIYLAFMPMTLIIFIGYRWYQSMKKTA